MWLMRSCLPPSVMRARTHDCSLANTACSERLAECGTLAFPEYCACFVVHPWLRVSYAIARCHDTIMGEAFL